MSMYVDADGKVHDGSEGDFDPLRQGHHLSGSGSTPIAAGAAKVLPRFQLPHLEIPSVPTGVYVGLAVAGVAFVGAPLLGLYVLARGARAAGQVAAAAAPTVAQIGPAVVPFVPQAAPVVAAASLVTAARSGIAPPSSPTADSAAKMVEDVATLLRTVGMAPLPSTHAAVPAHPAMAATLPPSSLPSSPSSSAPTAAIPEIVARGTLPSPAAPPSVTPGGTTLFSPR